MDDRSSSPDPLAESFNDNSKMPTRRRSRSVSENPVQKSFLLSDDVQISPSKTVTEQSLSPWRIRVTVEAEPEDVAQDQVDSERDQLKHRVITKTRKVPLQDHSDSQTKARKSSPAASSGSRSRRSASPHKRRPSVTDLNAIVLGDDGDEDEWTGKPVPRRRRRSSSNAGKRKSAGSRKSTETVEFEIREDEATKNEAIDFPDVESDPVQSQSPELREIDLNRVAMRSRGGSMRKDKDKEILADSFRKVSVNSMMSYPTPSPTASEHGNSDDKQDDLDGMPLGMDTLMESEGFTMIDLDSLPSVKHLRSSPSEPQDERNDEVRPRNGSHAITNQPKTMAAPAINLSIVEEETFSYQEHHLPSSPPKESRTEDDEQSSCLSSAPSYTVGHLKLPSSTNVQRYRHVTPMPVPMPSSPKLPSPPKQAEVVRERSPASAEKALQAGVALQSAIDPLILRGTTPQQSRDSLNLFEGFSSGTTRELRAGLRFGEELAKKPVRALQQPKDPQMRDQLAREQLSTDLRAQDEKIWQQGRDDVIRRASESHQTITIADDENSADESNSSQEEIVAADETLGDIWLAAAKKTPKPEQTQQSREKDDTPPKSQLGDGPRRKLIPSPWKRGEQIEAPDMSSLTADTSMSGIFWKQSDSSGSGHRFGEEVLAQPSRLAVLRAQDFPRRLSGEAAKRDSVSQDDDVVDHHAGVAHETYEWRDATEVVDEETNELEAEKELNNMTHLHETNLEDMPEQDMTYPVIKPLKFQHYDPNDVHDGDEDSQAAVSEESSHSEVEQYRQRTSLSPSKERPNTPRSALKGGRLSLGAHHCFDVADDNLGDKKVAWARRSTCMNEDWEESTRSVRSSQEDTIDETPTPLASEKVEHNNNGSQNTNEVPANVEQRPKKGWFSWMNKGSVTAEDQETEANAVIPNSSVPGLDGSADDAEAEADTSFVPTSKHDHTHDIDSVVIKRAPSSSASRVSPPTFRKSKTPSYLLPPSYPSDPTRNPKIPLSTSGTFTKTHLRAMHIIYAKSRKPRFHGPSYPNEVREEVRELVESDWKLEIDESKSFLGEVFTFKVGITEAIVLERFMREVEQGHDGEDVAWSWSAVHLAGWLGRVAVGEVVRAEEKALKS